MTEHYRLYPPFLCVAEEQDFSKVWEQFCCKLLNIDNRTTEIYVRNPPERGVDLYCPSKKIAYQCKSVRSGKSGDFKVSKSIESIQAAMDVKEELGWEKYVLCVNVPLSGAAEQSLRRFLPDIEILSSSYWVQLCEANPVLIERNFRRLLEVPRSRVLDAIHSRFADYYSEKLKRAIEESSFDIFLYCDRHDTTYRVPVSDLFSFGDLLQIFREFFKLPEADKITSEGIEVRLSHAVMFNGERMSDGITLRAAGVSHGDVLTCWTKFLWREADRKFEGDVMHMLTSDVLKERTKSLNERRYLAIAKFDRRLKPYFRAFDDELLVKRT